jgi:hypothetical protein
VVGLVDPAKLKPGDLVGVNKDSYLILDELPCEYVCAVTSFFVGVFIILLFVVLATFHSICFRLHRAIFF